MTAKDELFAIHKKCYAQRNVLTDIATITIDLSNFTPETMNYTAVREEAAAVISRLLGVRDVDKLAVADALNITQRNYSNQPFWRSLIVEWLRFANTEEKEKLSEQAAKTRLKAEEMLYQIQEIEAKEKATIKAYAAPLKEHNFAINGEKMMQNYLNMCRKDPKKAWETLITNPAWFSPIITHDGDGNLILTPDQAAEENKKIGKFLKRLSI